MGISVNIDVLLAKRKMSSTELAERIGITKANLSVLKTGKAKAIRFSTLEALCEALQCQPGDLLEFRDDSPAATGGSSLPEGPIATGGSNLPGGPITTGMPIFPDESDT